MFSFIATCTNFGSHYSHSVHRQINRERNLFQMADSVTKQETGGGESLNPAQPTVPAPIEVKTEPTAEKPEVLEIKPEVTEAKPDATPAPNTEAAKPPEGEIIDENEAKAEHANPEVAEVAAAEVKTEVTAIEDKPVSEVNGNDLSNGVDATNDWQQREKALLKKIEELEKMKNQSSENTTKMELKLREEQIDLLKARVRNLETELQAALSKPGPKNHEMIENIKQQHEELLSKARGMIFDKTKMVKNQELQIEALTTQVQSLKDINLITKDLLEIRNSEIKAMEDRLKAMEARFNMEKERYSLVLQRAQTSTNINDDLKKEYETQLKIFKELRTKYEQKVEALVAENNKLKLDLAKGSTSSETK